MQAISLAILAAGSARTKRDGVLNALQGGPKGSEANHPHVLRVRPGCCALSAVKLTAPITPAALSDIGRVSEAPPGISFNGVKRSSRRLPAPVHTVSLYQSDR